VGCTWWRFRKQQSKRGNGALGAVLRRSCWWSYWWCGKKNGQTSKRIETTLPRTEVRRVGEELRLVLGRKCSSFVSTNLV
jgi:hypothetical protein